MAIGIKVEPLDRDIAFMIAEDLSEEARSRALAAFARESIEDAQSGNALALGQTPAYEVVVDGRRNAPIEDVRADGVVVAEFDLLLDLFAWIGQQLVKHSPRRSGRYSQSHLFFVDGKETVLSGNVPVGAEYVFVNSQPYARKIDKGLSAQAPDGVYQAVAVVANQRFGNVARVLFGYRSLAAGYTSKAADRQPAIIVRMGR